MLTAHLDDEGDDYDDDMLIGPIGGGGGGGHRAENGCNEASSLRVLALVLARPAARGSLEQSDEFFETPHRRRPRHLNVIWS